MQREGTSTSTSPTAFRVTRTKAINRPTTWFSTNKSENKPTSMASPSPFLLGSASFKSPFPNKGKHKLSPSPSPRHYNDDDFVMISPVRPLHFSAAKSRAESGGSSSPLEESPTPACGMANATARLKLADDDSPIRRVPGQSRSLALGPMGGDAFLSTNGAGPSTHMPQQSPSRLKYSTTNLFPLADGDGDDGSPLMSTTPLLGEGPPPPPPQPLFPPLRTSQSQDCEASSSKSLFHPHNRDYEKSRIPRLSASHPLRARAATDLDRPTLGSKKAVSLDALPTNADKDEPFGIPVATALGKKSRPSSSVCVPGAAMGRAHKRINSGEQHNLASSISRSFGQKSGLALSLTPSPALGVLPDFSSNSSLSSLSTNHMTPPVSAFSPAEPPIFEHVKPLAEAFEAPNATVSRRFKPRDSGVSMGDEDKSAKKLMPPPSVMKPSYGMSRPRRPAMLKRTSSMGDERPDIETPSLAPQSGWPNVGPSQPSAFNFLGESGLAIGVGGGEKKPSMPDTPVKKHAYGHSHGGGPFGHRVGHSTSHPTLGSDYELSSGALADNTDATVNIPGQPRRSMMQPPPTAKKPPASSMKVPHLTLTGTSSPDSPSAMETDQASPTVRMGSGMNAQPKTLMGEGRVGLLQRQGTMVSSESEEEATPTKGGGERLALAARSAITTPTPSPGKSRAPPSAYKNPGPIMPRLSLPAFAAPKPARTLNHRQSHPAPASNRPEEDDVFEQRFITLEQLGKGAFSTVIKVQDRFGDGLYAVKKARGVFDGVKDRLRHLEEVDILRHLSQKPNSHVIKFEDAWEQNRQLFIQTELCLGSLAFFLEEYGRVVERLDEGRVWKIVRELSDGINHIHSNGVIHFDIKPANILISATGSLKIGDFGLATRYPRKCAAEILAGSGLGGVVPPEARPEKLEREGDRLYMPPEMLQGVFVMAADIFSFGLVLLEVSTNICVPDGGAPWHALRSDDFTVIDLSPLSPALTDLIMQCMTADFASRPTVGQILAHPIVQRARNGKDALAPEEPRWLADILTGANGFMRAKREVDGDVMME